MTAPTERPSDGPGAPHIDAALPVVPAPSDPMAVARRLVADQFTRGSMLWLRTWRGDFYEFDGRCWRSHDEAAIRAFAYGFLEHALYRDGRGELRKWRPTRPKVANLIEALRVVVRLRESLEPPAWLDHGGPDPGELIVTNNGILHRPTRQLLPHDPRLFSLVALPFDYDPAAAVPVGWLAFLDSLWGDETESIALLQEVAGYAVAGDRSLQKAILIVGPTRAGKGVIAGVVAALVGRPNVAAPTLAGLTTNFGLQDLISRTLAVVADARLGTRANLAALAERLLSISGQDLVRVDRKYQTPWTGRLGTLFLILTNELPRFSDASEALAKRFVVLVLRHSFYGREDRTLLRRLLTELPGIFNWALDGYERLRAQDHFTEPASARETLRELEDLSSPIAAFLRDECVVERHVHVVIDDLWNAWKSWCDAQGHYRGSLQTFGRDLRAAVPGLRLVQPREGDQRRREYLGIGLRVDNGQERVPPVPDPVASTPGTHGTHAEPLSSDESGDSTGRYRPTTASTFGPGPFEPADDQRFGEYSADRLAHIEPPPPLWHDRPDPRDDPAFESGNSESRSIEDDYPRSAFDGVAETQTDAGK